jgi:hypothetical protein
VPCRARAFGVRARSFSAVLQSRQTKLTPTQSRDKEKLKTKCSDGEPCEQEISFTRVIKWSRNQDSLENLPRERSEASILSAINPEKMTLMSPAQLNRLKNHKYSSDNASIIDPYLQPW